MKNKTSRRLGAIAGIAGVSAIALSSMGAGGAAAGALPGGSTTQKLVDGTNVTVKLIGESVNITPSTVAMPTSRNVWLSGKVLVDVAGEAEGGTVESGYVVGCQLNFGASSESGGGVKNTFATADKAASPSATAETSGGFTLAPGEAKYVPIIQDTNEKGKDVSDFTFEGAKGGIAYSQETFKVDGCAGFAQAKAYVKVTVETPSVTGIVTLWGSPFSIG